MTQTGGGTEAKAEPDVFLRIENLRRIHREKERAIVTREWRGVSSRACGGIAMNWEGNQGREEQESMQIWRGAFSLC